MVVLKKCESKLLYILAKSFGMCLKKSCFSAGSKVSSVVPVFKNVGERSTTNNHLLPLVSKVFKNL